MARLLQFVALVCLIPYVVAKYIFAANADSYNGFKVGEKVTNKKLCLSQGEGDFTFGMATSVRAGPIDSVFGADRGYSSSATLGIMDNGCKLLSAYKPSEYDKGVEIVIRENFLKYVLTITHISLSPPDPNFLFAYANGLYSIGNNGCGCRALDNVLSFNKGCRCAFPVAGEPN